MHGGFGKIGTHSKKSCHKEESMLRSVLGLPFMEASTCFGRFHFWGLGFKVLRFRAWASELRA